MNSEPLLNGANLFQNLVTGYRTAVTDPRISANNMILRADSRWLPAEKPAGDIPESMGMYDKQRKADLRHALATIAVRSLLGMPLTNDQDWTETDQTAFELGLYTIEPSLKRYGITYTMKSHGDGKAEAPYFDVNLNTFSYAINDDQRAIATLGERPRFRLALVTAPTC